MKIIKNILDKFIEFICIVIMIIMTLLVTWQVFVRYIFNNPSAITEQLSQYLFIWLILFGSAYIFGKREHMQILFIKEKMPSHIKFILDITQEILVLLFALCVLVLGGYFSSISQMVQVDASLQIPMGIIYSALPINGVFILFYSLQNINNILLNRNKKN